MPAAPPVISVTQSVGLLRSEREMLNVFGDAIVEVKARTRLVVSQWCCEVIKEVIFGQPRLLQRGVRGGEMPSMLLAALPLCSHHLYSIELDRQSQRKRGCLPGLRRSGGSSKTLEKRRVFGSVAIPLHRQAAQVWDLEAIHVDKSLLLGVWALESKIVGQCECSMGGTWAYHAQGTYLMRASLTSGLTNLVRRQIAAMVPNGAKRDFTSSNVMRWSISPTHRQKMSSSAALGISSTVGRGDCMMRGGNDLQRRVVANAVAVGGGVNTKNVLVCGKCRGSEGAREGDI